jgi:membrane protease YdiL (CAAX protease family)
MGISAFAKRHPVVTYYGLMFAISWGFGLIVLGPDGFVGSKPISGVQLPLVYVAALAGPIVTGLLSVGLVRGRAGMRDLLSRLLTWRVSVRWYAVALLTAPLLTILTLLALSLVSANFLPAIMRSGDKMRLLMSGIAVALIVPFGEELGWTGFAIPQLRQRYRRRCDRTHRRPAVGRVALPPLRRKRPVASLSGRAALFVVATLPSAHGVGL